MKPSHPRILALLLLTLGLASTAPASDSTVPIEYLRPMKNSVSVGVRLTGGATVTFGGPSLGKIDGTNLDSIYDYTTGQTFRQAYLQNGYIQYDDGKVTYRDSDAASADGNRPAQGNGQGGVSIPPDPDGRWRTYATLTSTTTNLSITATTGVFLPFDPNYDTTRIWSAASTAQTGTNADGTSYVDMSTYASLGSPDTVQAKSSAHPGIEIQYSRVVQRFKHFEWGINATFGLSEFNAKTTQTIKANAIRHTDHYQVYAYSPATNGLAKGNLYSGPSIVNADGTPATIYASGTAVDNPTTIDKVIYGPSFVGLAYNDADGSPKDADGNTLSFTGGYETTTPLGIGTTDSTYAPQTLYYDATTGQTTTSPTNADGNPNTTAIPVPGGTIRGYWQVKGVYYLMRLGPMIRVPIGKNFSAAISAGYIAGWAGSKMRFSEVLDIPNITTKPMSVPDPKTGTYSNDISKYNQKYLSGMYLDANFEWWVSTRTGFYAGLVYEKLSNYKQRFYDYLNPAYYREASVKMDNGLGLHFGIITRF